MMLTQVRRWLQPLADKVEQSGQLSALQLMLVLVLFGVSACTTEWLGLHAVFGGFLLGVAMPRGKLTELVSARLEKITVYQLLPMFFTYSGLKTQLNVLASFDMLMIALIILAASVFAKGIACWGAARLGGADNRTAMAVGALMNARGLMELIIINIALKFGVIEQGLFSIMVLMATVTTFMASPLLQLCMAGIWRKPIRPSRGQQRSRLRRQVNHLPVLRVRPEKTAVLVSLADHAALLQFTQTALQRGKSAASLWMMFRHGKMPAVV